MRMTTLGSGDALDALQTRIEALGGWTWEQQVGRGAAPAATRCRQPAAALSGGTQKRAALAQGMVAQPGRAAARRATNHLDLDAISGCRSCWWAGAAR